MIKRRSRFLRDHLKASVAARPDKRIENPSSFAISSRSTTGKLDSPSLLAARSGTHRSNPLPADSAREPQLVNEPSH
jgi:hypothetical protein